MPAPVVVTAVFTPKKDAFDKLIIVLSAAIAQVHDEEGCLLYAIHRDPEDRIIMIEKWTSTEHLDAHGSSKAVERLNRDSASLLAAPVIVTRLVPIPAGNPVQGQL